MQLSPETRSPRQVSRRAAAAFLLLTAVFLAGLYTGIHQMQTWAQTSAEQAENSSSSSPTTSITFGSSGRGEQPSGIDFSPLWLTWDVLNNDFVRAHASGTVPTDEE